MQLALRSGSAGAGFVADPASVTRTNKILVGTVAALSASVIAVSPAAQTSASMVVHEAQAAQQRAVALVAEVTDSPLTVYGDLIDNTVYNVGTLLKQYAAAPLPILTAIVENQVGYLKRILDFSVVSSAFQTWWNDGSRESAPGKDLLASVGSALSKGDIATAYQNFNSLALFGIQNTVLPWLNNWLFSTSTTMGVPQQIFQNISNALGSFFTTGTLVYGAFQSLYAPVSGAAFQFSRDLAEIGSALGKGNVVGAIAGLVNTPGSVLNALLNGFTYNDTTNPWAGLLSPKDPACTGRCAGGGPISQFFITIAQKIAAVLKVSTSTTTTTAAATAAVAAAASDTTSSVVAETLGTNVTSYTLSLDSATTSTATADAKAATDTKATADAKAAADTKTEDTTTAAVATVADTGATKTAADTTSDTTATGTSADTTSASTVTKTDAGSSTKGSSSDSSSSDASSSDSSSSGKSSKRSGKHDSDKSGSAKSDSGSSTSSAGSSDSAGSTKHSAKHDSAKHDSAKSGSAKSDSGKSGSSKGGSGKHASSKHKSGSSS